MDDKMKQAALWWVQQGFTIFPLRPRDKKPPEGFKWKDQCTQDPNKVNRLWTKYKDANIAIVCGKPSGNLLVIDLDVDDNTGANGYDDLHDWEAANGELPETFRVITGKGGMHLYYRTDGRKIINKVRLYDGIDLRYDDAYVVAPPSVHPETGALYMIEEEVDGTPEIAEANDAVYKFIADGIPKDLKEKPQELMLGKPIPEGMRDWTMFRAAAKMRNMGLSEDGIVGALNAENQLLCDPPLTLGQLRKIARSAAKYDPKDSYLEGVADGVIIENDGTPGDALETYSANELSQLDLHPPEMIVEKLLPVGIGILAAPSKAGKSWMVLDLGLSVANGEPFLGYATKKRGVLYLALEDSMYRVNDRMQKIMDGADLPDGLRITIKSQRTNTGLIEQLRKHLEEYPDTGLIIIDTLQMIRPPKGRIDAYEFDYNIMGKLRTIVVEYNLSMLLVHHTRKANGFDSDPFESILGSTALQGATDFMYTLKQGKDGFDILYGKGRDISNIELAVDMDWTTYHWRAIGSVSEVRQDKEWRDYLNSPITVTIKAMLAEVEGASMISAKEVKLKMSELRDEVRMRTGEVIGSSARDFGRIVGQIDDKLLKDGIEHIYPESKRYIHTFKTN